MREIKKEAKETNRDKEREEEKTRSTPVLRKDDEPKAIDKNQKDNRKVKVKNEWENREREKKNEKISCKG